MKLETENQRKISGTRSAHYLKVDVHYNLCLLWMKGENRTFAGSENYEECSQRNGCFSHSARVIFS
jgi:hypothetical protein